MMQQHATVQSLHEINGTMSEDDRSGYYNVVNMYMALAKELGVEHVMEEHRVGILKSIQRGNGIEAGYRIRQAAAALQ